MVNVNTINLVFIMIFKPFFEVRNNLLKKTNSTVFLFGLKLFNPNFHPPVLLPVFRCVVRSDGCFLAKADHLIDI